MPSPPPDPYIQLWFTELKKFQAACINNSARKLPLLKFANSIIATTLPSTASQNNFLTSVAASTGYADLQPTDLTTCKTFRALLDYCHLLENDIFNALQTLSVPTVQAIDSVSYYATPVATAFPGGSIGAGWIAAQGLLMASMNPTCLTLPFRISVNATVDKAGATMKNLIQQIVGLG